MPPKYKFNKQEIILAGFNIVSSKGSSNLTAREIAKELGSSPKVIFGSFSGMGELKQEIINYTKSYYEQKILSAISSSSLPYKASGIAYINFAKNETNLFNLLFVENKVTENDKSLDVILSILMDKFNITKENAKVLHLESWAFVHGIAILVASKAFDISDELIDKMLEDYFKGVVLRVKEKDGSN